MAQPRRHARRNAHAEASTDITTQAAIAPKTTPPDHPTPLFRAINANAKIGPAVMNTGISKINPRVTRLAGAIAGFAAEKLRREIMVCGPDGCVTVAISALSVT
ncbi:hypothetical protein [Nocardia sp. NPDC058480]|uniref:hypothetical protein n=1 Tax=unclassified Nocardia TaxID=2637762 RepID=UPI0036588484